MVAVDITPSRPLGVDLGMTKLKAAIPSGWDAKQFEYKYKELFIKNKTIYMFLKG